MSKSKPSLEEQLESLCQLVERMHEAIKEMDKATQKANLEYNSFISQYKEFLKEKR